MDSQRLCATCDQPFYWDGQDWKTHCLKCFDTLAKKCACGRSIRINAAKWMNVCSACFLEKRRLTHGICPGCPPERSTRLSRPLDKDLCPDCETKRRKRPQPEPVTIMTHQRVLQAQEDMAIPENIRQRVISDYLEKRLASAISEDVDGL